MLCLGQLTILLKKLSTSAALAISSLYLSDSLLRGPAWGARQERHSLQCHHVYAQRHPEHGFAECRSEPATTKNFIASCSASTRSQTPVPEAHRMAGDIKAFFTTWIASHHPLMLLPIPCKSPPKLLALLSNFTFTFMNTSSCLIICNIALHWRCWLNISFPKRFNPPQRKSPPSLCCTAGTVSAQRWQPWLSSPEKSIISVICLDLFLYWAAFFHWISSATLTPGEKCQWREQKSARDRTGVKLQCFMVERL